MKKLLLASGVLLISLTGCATASKSANISDDKATQQSYEMLKTIVSVPDRNNTYLMDIPSRGTLADNLMIGAIKSGRNLSVIQDLDTLFSKNQKIAISGHNGSLNIAVLESALKQAKGGSTSTIYIQATPEQLANLQSIATPKGITVKSY